MSEENNNTDSLQEENTSAGVHLEKPSADVQSDSVQGNGTADSYGEDIYQEGSPSYTGTYQNNSGNYSYQGDYSYQNYEEPVQESMGFGIASMVLGIISLVLFCTCCNLLLAVLAIIFGIIHLVKCKSGKGFAIAGIITAGLSVVFFFVYMFVFFGSSAFQEEFQKEFQRQFQNQMEQNFGDDYENYDFSLPFEDDYDYDYDEDEDDSDSYHHEDEHNDTF